MGLKSYMTSADLIESVKRNIIFPISQNTFSEQDILRFANEEMMVNLIPQIMSYHEEFFVYNQEVPLIDQQGRYPIPKRAIGMKLRDMYYKDTGNNIFEMTRINADDKGFFQRNLGTDQSINKFYFENNDIVLTPLSIVQPQGSLVMQYFIRPNQLVTNDRAAISDSFIKTLNIDNATLIAGDILTINGVNFVADTDFAIGATSIDSATNLTMAINSSGISLSSTNGIPSTSTISITFEQRKNTLTSSNDIAINISSSIGIQCISIPTHIVTGLKIDFLQTEGGHKLFSFDQLVPVNSILGSVIYFQESIVPYDFVAGDYICEQYECIVPQVPDDLHAGLAQRTCGRILASMGDQNGTAISQAKINDIEARQGVMIDNRDDGSPQKILSRHTLLRLNKNRFRRF